VADNRSARRAHGELEAEVLAAIAAAERPLTVQDVQRQVDRQLSYTAVHTILTRLTDKGLVERERVGRGFVYRPAVHADRVIAARMDALLRSAPVRTAVLRSFLSALRPEDETLLREWLAGRGEDDPES
jgi:predicted transcriptional regulator